MLPFEIIFLCYLLGINHVILKSFSALGKTLKLNFSFLVWAFTFNTINVVQSINIILKIFILIFVCLFVRV